MSEQEQLSQVFWNDWFNSLWDQNKYEDRCENILPSLSQDSSRNLQHSQSLSLLTNSLEFQGSLHLEFSEGSTKHWTRINTFFLFLSSLTVMIEMVKKDSFLRIFSGFPKIEITCDVSWMFNVHLFRILTLLNSLVYIYDAFFPSCLCSYTYILFIYHSVSFKDKFIL